MLLGCPWRLPCVLASAASMGTVWIDAGTCPASRDAADFYPGLLGYREPPLCVYSRQQTPPATDGLRAAHMELAGLMPGVLPFQ